MFAGSTGFTGDTGLTGGTGFTGATGFTGSTGTPIAHTGTRCFVKKAGNVEVPVTHLGTRINLQSHCIYIKCHKSDFVQESFLEKS